MSTIEKKLLDWLSTGDLAKYALSVHDKDQIACAVAESRLWVEGSAPAWLFIANGRR